jgi:hypothetical protein
MNSDLNVSLVRPDNPRRIRTVPFRMSFPILPPMPPRIDEASGRKTYGLMMLFPPPFDQKPYRTALREAMVFKFGSEQRNWPRCKRTPDDVIKDYAEYNANSKSPLQGDWSGWFAINANAIAADGNIPPSVVGQLKGPDDKFPVITDLREIYAGRWARATIDAYYYDVKGKSNGVTFGLSNVQLLKPDTRFGFSKPPAERDFDDVTGEMAGEGDAFETGQVVSFPKDKETSKEEW